MTWLEKIIKSNSELESPLSFWKWAALTSISAVVKDNVWLNRHRYKLYPNIYVMFHADSGLKKGPAVALATRLVTKVNNTKVITGRSSIQGILKELGQAKTQPGGKIKTNTSAFICSSELSSSIVDDKAAADILTDLYDRHWRVGQWRSLLKMESFSLNNPTITMLTATNEAHSSDFFAKKDVQGGYFARTFIIHEHQENRPNSLILPPKFGIDETEIIEYLKQVAQLTGQFQELGGWEKTEEFSKKWINEETGEVGYYTEAGQIYEEWYYDFKRKAKLQFLKDETGTQNRIGDSVLKVAMLLSLARAPDLIIDSSAMGEAIKTCEDLIINVRQTTLGARGLSESSSFKAKIIHELIAREGHSISKQMLMKKMWMHYTDTREIDEIMDSLQASGMIAIDTVGNQVIYRMLENQVEELTKFVGRKQR